MPARHRAFQIVPLLDDESDKENIPPKNIIFNSQNVHRTNTIVGERQMEEEASEDDDEEEEELTSIHQQGSGDTRHVRDTESETGEDEDEEEEETIMQNQTRMYTPPPTPRRKENLMTTTTTKLQQFENELKPLNPQEVIQQAERALLRYEEQCKQQDIDKKRKARAVNAAALDADNDNEGDDGWTFVPFKKSRGY